MIYRYAPLMKRLVTWLVECGRKLVIDEAKGGGRGQGRDVGLL
jgi:hypothetical protein